MRRVRHEPYWELGTAGANTGKTLAVPASPPELALEWFLIGANAPSGLQAELRSALRLVSPNVLAGRVRAVLDCDMRGDLTQTKMVPMI